MKAVHTRMVSAVLLSLVLSLALLPAFALAEETAAPTAPAAAAPAPAPAPKIDTGDTAWMTVATALVILFMVLYYGVSGFVADLAVLRGDTRYLLQRGLATLRNTQRPGLIALLEAAEIIPSSLSA
mgnify:CR=1 FL=1